MIVHNPIDSKNQYIHLLEPKRSKAINIGLSNLSNYSFQDIHQAILNCDTEILNKDSTESLITILPSPTELEMIQTYIDKGGDPEKLAPPENFIASLIGIPLLQERLEAHYAILFFHSEIDTIMHPLMHIYKAARAVVNSKRYRAFSETVLRTLNKVRHEHPSAGKFTRLDFSIYKGIVEYEVIGEPSKSILRYVIEELVKTDEDALKFHEDLAACEKAATVDIDVVKGHILKLTFPIDKIQKTVAKAKEINDPLADVLSHFIKFVEEFIPYVDEEANFIMGKFHALCKFHGYPQNEISKLTPKHVFGMLWYIAESARVARIVQMYDDDSVLSMDGECLVGNSPQTAEDKISIRLSKYIMY